jgi:HPt (histidine-containing phosphotransfer) domain-containing protein
MNYALPDPLASPPSRASAEAAPVLDPAALRALQQLRPGAGAEFVAKVLAAYERSLQKHALLARQAWQQAQWQALSQSAHALKAASSSVGALALARMSSELELAVYQDDEPLVLALAPCFLAEIERVAAALAAMPGVVV